MSDTIIAAVDLDAPRQTHYALALATWLADATSCELVAATVFAPRPGALSIQLEHRQAALAERAGRPVETVAIAGTAPARLLHELAERHPGAQLALALGDVPTERIELEGDPAAALATAARDLDLLIVGSRSYGPLGAVLLGAVTRQLVRMASCPVMVVPRVRDAALAVALIGGMEADVDD